MIYIVIWLLFGVGCAIAANGKNRFTPGWFLLGVLLGPFGLLFILLLPKLEDQNAAAQPPAKPRPLDPPPPSAKICPKCGQRYQPWAAQCSECDVPLEPVYEPEPKPAEPKGPPPVAKFCPQCKQRYVLGAVKCSDCGVELEPTHLTAEEQAEADRIQAEAERQAAEYKTCPFCAETIKAAAIKCRHCGSMLEGEAQPKG